jgi:hypothetical protein
MEVRMGSHAELRLSRRSLLVLALSTTSAAAFSTGARAQTVDFSALLGSIRAFAQAELQSRLSRLGLLEFAYEFRWARLQTMPLGYENDEFRLQTQPILDALARILPQLDPDELKEPDGEFSEAARIAADKNLGDLAVVLERIPSVPTVVQQLSVEEIVRFQLLIWLILYQTEKSLWDAARGLSFCYPLSDR